MPSCNCGTQRFHFSGWDAPANHLNINVVTELWYCGAQVKITVRCLACRTTMIRYVDVDRAGLDVDGFRYVVESQEPTVQSRVSDW
jgi:hypothetical protein